MDSHLPVRFVRILVKGAGDLASGVIYRLWKAGFLVFVTEIARPTAVRRTVSFASAVYEGSWTVQGVTARRVEDLNSAFAVQQAGFVPVLVDPEASVRSELNPHVVVDGIMAKRNTGTHIDDAPIVVALGPGFTAGVDCHAVVETQRGHNLGRVLYTGSAAPNTGVPGDVGGYTWERVLRAPTEGTFRALRSIGEIVNAGDTVAVVDGQPVVAAIRGVLRGLIHDGLKVSKGQKVGDVDSRADISHCFSISDKALSVGGGVLEAVLHLLYGQDR
jgi:xanthine dehydrogenase accessory factor